MTKFLLFVSSILFLQSTSYAEGAKCVQSQEQVAVVDVCEQSYVIIDEGYRYKLVAEVIFSNGKTVRKTKANHLLYSECLRLMSSSNRKTK